MTDRKELLKQTIREIALDNNALWEEMDKVDNLGVDIIAQAILDKYEVRER